MSETRKIAAILVSDVVGYSRLAGADEDRILARLRALRSDLIDPTIAVHHGRVVKRTEDGTRSKSHPRKALVLAALLLPRLARRPFRPRTLSRGARSTSRRSRRPRAPRTKKRSSFASTGSSQQLSGSLSI